MPKLRTFCAVSLAFALAGIAWAASPTTTPPSHAPAKGSVITDHISQLDGPVTMSVGPDGRTWAAWAYRAKGEFDIAVTATDANAAAWSAPIFFGRRNGSDDVEPAIAVGSDGTVYLAFATTNPSRVSIAVLSPSSSSWTEPVIVSGMETASSPALSLLGGRLIVAFRTEHGVRIVLPSFDGENELHMGDGPDPIGSIKDKRVPPAEPLPMSSPRPGR